MNDNTTKLIEQLAQKMGTTTEYLWGVLLRQAPVNATVTLIQFIFIALFGIFLYKAHIRLSKKDVNEKWGETGYEKYEAGASIPMVILTIIFIVLSIGCFFCIEDIISGYFNPEYWALKQILDTINPK